jgi:hypothetical protein
VADGLKLACYDSQMTGDDIRRFLRRDWSRLAAAKARTWQAGKGTPGGDLRAANELRRYARMARADWPGTDDRAEDLRTHVRVSEALGAVGLRSR